MKAIVRNWKALLAIVLVLAAAAVYFLGYRPSAENFARQREQLTQQNAQLHRGDSLIQLLLIGCSGRNVSRIPDRIQHPLPHIRPHMGTVVQHPVHCPPGDPRQICHHLNCRSLSHKLLRPLAADSASLYTPAQ